MGAQIFVLVVESIILQKILRKLLMGLLKNIKKEGFKIFIMKIRIL
jgi:hypothetical protein